MTDQAFTSALDAARGLARIELGRPERGNVLTAEEACELGSAIRHMGSQPQTRVVVIAARGDAFCLGRAPAPSNGTRPSAVDIRRDLAEPILSLYADIRATDVPVVAVVHGEAKGLGCAIAGVCDLAIAADRAVFSFPEMDANLPPTLAISAVLGKVAPKHIMHLVLTRRRIDAAEAHAIGLVSEVHAHARLSAAVDRTLDGLVDRSRPALCAVKAYLQTAQRLDPVAAAQLAATTIATVLSSREE